MKKEKIIICLNLLLLVIIIIFLGKFLKNKSDKNLCKNCNVILISLDTLSANHMPCYGYDKDTMPNLCKFGKENILFQNSYSTSYWTLPSHMSIFTGLYPTTHKVLKALVDSLNPKYKTITEILKANGYNTLYFGPRHDIYIPLDKGIGSGFDYIENEIHEIQGWEKGLNMLAENQKNNKKTFLFLHTYSVHYPYYPEKKDPYKFIDMSKSNPKILMTKEEYDKGDESFVAYAVDDFKKRLETAKTEESKKLDQSYLDTLLSNKTLDEKVRLLNKADSGTFHEQWQMEQIKTKSDLDFYRSLYDETVFDLDNFLGGFLTEIKNKKLDKDTIIVITSDHGEGFKEHGEFDHCGTYPYCLYNETTKVPLIISIPGIKNKKIKNVVQGIDIYPTILSYLGIEKPTYVEGMDLKSLINNILFKNKHKYIISEQDFKGKIVVDEKSKLYINDMDNLSMSKSIMFFDLTKDKREMNDISKMESKKVSEMMSFVKDFSKRPGGEKIDNSTIKLPNWLDETRKKRLLENGYF